jgi:hypothetical protein
LLHDVFEQVAAAGLSGCLFCGCGVSTTGYEIKSLLRQFARHGERRKAIKGENEVTAII